MSSDYVEPLLWSGAALLVGALVVGFVVAYTVPLQQRRRGHPTLPYAVVTDVKTGVVRDVPAGTVLLGNTEPVRAGQKWFMHKESATPSGDVPRIFLRDENANSALSVYYTSEKTWPDGKIASAWETWSVHNGVFRRIADPTVTAFDFGTWP